MGKVSEPRGILCRRWGNCSPEKLSDLLKAAQQVSGRAQGRSLQL